MVDFRTNDDLEPVRLLGSGFSVRFVFVFTGMYRPGGLRRGCDSSSFKFHPEIPLGTLEAKRNISS